MQETRDSASAAVPGKDSPAVRSMPGHAKGYRFTFTERCNMCGSGRERQVLMGRRLDRHQGFWPRHMTGITVSIFRCRTCGLVYPNPMPLPLTLEQHYETAPEEYWPDAYFQVDPDYLLSQIKTFERLSRRAPPACSALDVGAGIGKAMVALDRAGFRVSGIEPSPSFRRAAIQRTGVPDARLQLAAIESAAFPPDSFDFIHFGAVLEHLADPAAALRKSLGWLKPGGLIHLQVPSSAFLLSRLVRLFYRLTGAGGYVINTSPMHAPYHLYEFGLESFVRHGAEAGYAVAMHEYYPCAGYMPRWLIGAFDAAMKWTDTGMQLAVWLTKPDGGDGTARPLERVV